MGALRSLIICFAVFSKIPMPYIDWEKKDMKYIFCFLPLVGVVMGALFIGLNLLAQRFNVPETAFGIISFAVAMLLVNGGIHMDGFMDTIDALSSHKSRDDKIRILDDPHTGAFAIIYAIFSGNLEQLNNSIFESTESTIQITLTLLGTMCLWSGLMKIASNLSLIDKFCKMLNPIINFLFPDLKKNEKIKKEISMNMTANILGLGNAATPLGLKAMSSMQKENNKKDTLSDSMLMFILINTASIQIIPTTVLAIRKSLGSENSTGILVPVWGATILAAVAGIIVAKLLIKKDNK